MRKTRLGAILITLTAVMACLSPGAALAYGPGDMGYGGNYYGGGPGTNYGDAQVNSDSVVRAYPGFNTNVPDASSYDMGSDYWWNYYDEDYWDDWYGWDEDDGDWWNYSGGPGVNNGQGWRYSPNGWWYQVYGGGWLSGGWQFIRSRWYRFDNSGYMVTGWYQDGNGYWYYLNPVDDGTLGMMRTGWQVIDGKTYYFNPQSDGTMGRMYVNTTTPDGYLVGADGALVR